MAFHKPRGSQRWFRSSFPYSSFARTQETWGQRRQTVASSATVVQRAGIKARPVFVAVAKRAGYQQKEAGPIGACLAKFPIEISAIQHFADRVFQHIGALNQGCLFL